MTPAATSAATRTVSIPTNIPADVTLTESGAGRPVLLLHGGAGPQSVETFAQLLAAEHQVRALVPSHPGFGGTPRQDGVGSIRDLADLYVALLDHEDLDDVLVVGNSIGGWIAAEMAATRTPRVTGLVLVGAVGLPVPGHPVADFFTLDLAQVADLSFADPDRFRVDPASLPPEALAAMSGARAALRAYAGTTMVDPGLAARLAVVDVPTLVAWGDHDRIVDPEVGAAYADAIPGARLQMLPATGHLPQLESPALLAAAVDGMLHGTAALGATDR